MTDWNIKEKQYGFKKGIGVKMQMVGERFL